MHRPNIRYIYCTHIIDYLLHSTPVPHKEIAQRVGCSPSVVDRRWRCAPNAVRQGRAKQKHMVKAARLCARDKLIREAQELRDLGATVEQAGGVVGRSSDWVLHNTTAPSCALQHREFEHLRIVEAYRQPGASVRSVATLSGVNRDTVARIVREAGATKDSKEWRRAAPSKRQPYGPHSKPTVVRAVLTLRSQKYKYKEITDLLDVPASTAWTWVRKYGGGAKNHTHQGNTVEGSPAAQDSTQQDL